MDDKQDVSQAKKIVVGAGLLGFGYLLYDAIISEKPIYKKLLSISDPEITLSDEDIKRMDKDELIYKCWKCKNVVEKNATFCPSCGAGFSDVT